MLTRTGLRAREWAAREDTATNVVGTARTLLALATLGTLLFSRTTSIWMPSVGEPQPITCTGLRGATLFCLAGEHHLEVARWIGVAILAAAASGWRPRFTGIPHWWVAWSLNITGVLVDGGDQVAAILSLLLIPVTLADGRRWHWQRSADDRPLGGGAELARLLALSAVCVIRLQMAGIYFHAAVSKMAVKEWHNGTAVYYWFTEPSFGLPAYLRPLVLPLLASAAGVTLLTWGAMAVETFLFTGLVMDRRWRPYLLVAGLFFHLCIALAHGLGSFSLAMWAGLILYLRPLGQEFAVPAFARGGVRRASAALAARRPRPNEREVEPEPAVA
jgi:antimicrobial peptide system SdpB family protein